MDYVFAVRRVLRTLKPALVVVAETEIWPNLFREVHRTGAGLAVVNGRISDKALPKYLRLRRVFPVVLAAADTILAQTEEMRQRFLALGAERVTVGGNLKYDFAPQAADAGSPVVQLIERARPAKVWIAASTMADERVDEDDAVIAAWRRMRGVFLMLVPRKPERFDVVAGKLDAAGIGYVRRSRLDQEVRGADAPGVLLLDSIGELGGLFGLADCVFMGGTLAARGGHNILEPALFGKPVIVGPHMENFQAIADEFRAAGAVVEVGGAEELAGAVERVLANDDGMGDAGARVRGSAARGNGARGGGDARTVSRAAVPSGDALVSRGMGAGAGVAPGGQAAAVAVLCAAAQAGRAGDQRRQSHDGRNGEDSVRAAPGGVVARTRAEAGDSDARSTGGPRRWRRWRCRRVRRCAPRYRATSRRSSCGRGWRRWESGRTGIAPARCWRGSSASDVVLLDDGFQHVKLARNFDVVLVDALNPFGGGEVFPMGRLREPVQALARADAIVITRSEASDLGPAIEREVRRWNPRAPIFRARVEPEWWVEHRTGRKIALEEMKLERAGAFCGLGNPQSFYRTLEALGVRYVDCVEFEDHHRYLPTELMRITGAVPTQGRDGAGDDGEGRGQSVRRR